MSSFCLDEIARVCSTSVTGWICRVMKSHVQIKNDFFLFFSICGSSSHLRPIYSSQFPLSQDEYQGCRGSAITYRGYPCALWTIFHSLTVSQCERQDKHPGPDRLGVVLDRTAAELSAAKERNPCSVMTFNCPCTGLSSNG
ncbi:unnamed protein product [Echinostoma caproni]|uniref:Uncharacterized protein n=1 Tax=Echinostoma caproni TaxID=27848 RepID=A0A3P8FF28_9TREM|nr:unnamed protein product [Echinostoma caproni]